MRPTGDGFALVLAPCISLQRVVEDADPYGWVVVFAQSVAVGAGFHPPPGVTGLRTPIVGRTDPGAPFVTVLRMVAVFARHRRVGWRCPKPSRPGGGGTPPLYGLGALPWPPAGGASGSMRPTGDGFALVLAPCISLQRVVEDADPYGWVVVFAQSVAVGAGSRAACGAVSLGFGHGKTPLFLSGVFHLFFNPIYAVRYRAYSTGPFLPGGLRGRPSPVSRRAL